MKSLLKGIWLVMLAVVLSGGVALAQVPTTTVTDTVYRADGTPASGTVLIRWGAFTTAGGSTVAAGSTSVAIGAGGNLTVALAPNAGATPMGTYYTVLLHLDDGTTSEEFWVVPAAVAGGGPVTVGAIRNSVLPSSVAMQTVSKQYVDAAIAAAQTGFPEESSPYVRKAGDTLTGPLVLPADPVTANQAADKNYVDETVTAATSGTIAPARLPVFHPSGTTHAVGAVPDPGATAGNTRYLREDGTWDVPAGGGSSGAPATNPAGGQNNYAPVDSAVFTTSARTAGYLGLINPANTANQVELYNNSDQMIVQYANGVQDYLNSGGWSITGAIYASTGISSNTSFAPQTHGLVGSILQTGLSANTDLVGMLTLTAGSTTSASFTFAGSYANAPVCLVQPQSASPATVAALGAWSAQVSTTTLSVSTSTSAGSSVTFGYVCVARN